MSADRTTEINLKETCIECGIELQHIWAGDPVKTDDGRWICESCYSEYLLEHGQFGVGV